MSFLGLHSFYRSGKVGAAITARIGGGVLLAGLVASAVLTGPAHAEAQHLPNFHFSRIPRGYHLSHIAWEDETDTSMTMNTEYPAGMTVLTLKQARSESAFGPFMAPGGTAFYFGTPGDAMGDRGQVVWEFTGPSHQELCAVSPVLRLPDRGSWGAARIPLQVSSQGMVAWPGYQFFRSRDGQWTKVAATLTLMKTPNRTGYLMTWEHLPLDWQLSALRFVGHGHTLKATVGQALGEAGTSPYFSEAGIGWSFNYPPSDVGWRGVVQAGFDTGTGSVAWVSTGSIQLRG